MTFTQLEEALRDVRLDVLAAAGWILLGLLLVGVLLLVVKPSFDEYQRLLLARNDIASGASELGPAVGQQTIARLEGEITELNDQLYGGASATPPREVESHVVETLGRMSAGHDVELMGIVPGEPSRELGFEELPYEVQASGGYLPLFDWLDAVEHELRPMVVKEFDISPQPRSGRLKLSIRLVAYRAPRGGE